MTGPAVRLQFTRVAEFKRLASLISGFMLETTKAILNGFLKFCETQTSFILPVLSYCLEFRFEGFLPRHGKGRLRACEVSINMKSSPDRVNVRKRQWITLYIQCLLSEDSFLCKRKYRYSHVLDIQ